MSPLNRGPLLGHRVPPTGARLPPPPRFGGRLPPPGMPPRMPPPPMGAMFGPMRQRIPPPLPPRPGSVPLAGGPMSLYTPRGRGIPPLVPPMVGVRGVGPRGPPVRPWPRAGLPPQGLPHMRPRFPIGNGNIKSKVMNSTKKIHKLEELELKKPWMTDEIRNEIQKKNKLYAKAKKNKDAKEWEEFKDLRNKVTRMIRDAKNEYLAKNPEQAHLYNDEEPYDQRDENHSSSEEEKVYYCEVCDKEFASEELLSQHNSSHKICGIDGCTFSAHPLLVDKHIKMQHVTGLYQRMQSLFTSDDIEKWKSERKRKYPTKANVELKKAQELEKKERGEIINEKSVTMRSKSKRKMRGKRRKPRKRYNRLNNVPVYSDELYRGLCVFPGTACLTERNVNEREDDDDDKSCGANVISDEEEFVNLQSTNMSTVSCLPNLVANYGSDSEDDGPEEAPIKKLELEDIPDNITESVPKHTNTKNSEIMHPESCTVGTNTSRVSNTKSAQVRSAKNEEYKQNNYRNRYNVDRLQLLQKLLSRSIQHERNLICQCVKYIVDNNFFDQL